MIQIQISYIWIFGKCFVRYLLICFVHFTVLRLFLIYCDSEILIQLIFYDIWVRLWNKISCRERIIIKNWSILGITMMKPPWWMPLKNLMKLRIWKVLEDTLSRFAIFFMVQRTSCSYIFRTEFWYSYIRGPHPFEILALPTFRIPSVTGDNIS